MMNWLKRVNAIQTTDTSETKKITDHNYSNKYITTEEFNNLVLEDLAARLAQGNLANKNSISAFSKKTFWW